MQLVKVLKMTAIIEGLTKNVLVSIETEHDDFDSQYMEQSDVDEINASLEAGRIECVCVKVTARFTDLSHFDGTDTMGQVFLRGSMDLGQKDLDQTVSEYDMAQKAIDELVEQVLQGKSQIDTFLGKAA